MTEISARAETIRRELPFAVQKFTQFAVDNPGQMVALGAGTVVMLCAARNIIRPRTVLEALALQLVLTAAAPLALKQIIERGWLEFKVRDADGNLVIANPRKAE